MTGTVILGGARTPIGKMSGALASFEAVDLGGFAIGAALERSGVAPDDVEYVLMGQVLQAGTGQITARQAAVRAGIPMTVPATTVNKVCLSGMNTVYLGAQMVKAGDAAVVVAGGMESMTNAPFLLPKARAGYRFGHVETLDSIVHDGLWCTFDHCVMGASTDHYTAGTAHSRARQDEFAAASHERAARATKDGLMGEELVAVEVPQRRGEPIRVTEDEGIRADSSPDSLGGLPPAFTPGGTVTAGNASQISDGGSALVLASRAAAEARGVEPIAEILGYGQVAGPDTSLLSQPSRAILAALDQAGLGVADVDLFEINEAFAAVALASVADLGVSLDVVNVNGGAIALGHPIGMSGNRLVLTLVSELRRRGGGIGAAGLCGGGGQGDAIVVRVG